MVALIPASAAEPPISGAKYGMAIIAATLTICFMALLISDLL
jgi:hypothetical protein